MSAFREGDRVSLLATVRHAFPDSDTVTVALPDGNSSWIKPADLKLVRAVFEVGDEVRKSGGRSKGVILALTGDGEDALVESSDNRRLHVETCLLTRWTPDDEERLSTAKTRGDGWIKWDGGGPCPVSDRAVIEARLRGCDEVCTATASDFRWNHTGATGPTGDIVAYRVLSEG